MTNGAIIKICQVIDVYDETDGERIKVRMNPEDRDLTDDEIPYAFPLLPKMLHIKPKINELVLIILTKVGENNSVRYYIGPIISQPQFMDNENDIRNALSLYNGGRQPDVAPSTNADSHGAFAKNDDIAIYGRNKNDIILTDNDIRIRCGSRMKDRLSKGGIVFNRSNPSFIHLKHSDNIRGKNNDEYKSTATIVADKINLLGNRANKKFRTNDKNDLIPDDEMQKIIDTAYKLPYGEVLVDFLKLFVKVFSTHYHTYPGMIPTESSDHLKLTNYDFDSMLSESVRIN